eukprot:8656029-Prorocentrum_lima.AAC.1
MTSSLVGSEMCIRDRFTRLFVQPGELLVTSQEQHKTFLALLSLALDGNCLLYTSDAADDM